MSAELPPTILTIFGATGDLSANFLLPALYHMDAVGMLPKDFRLVCVGRRNFTKQQYLDFIIKKSESPLFAKKGLRRKRFLKNLIYYRGDFSNPDSFASLTKILSCEDDLKGRCFNRLYYFATSPELFVAIAKILKSADLLRGCHKHKRTVRILVEKPFGFSLASARRLNRILLRFFREDQIYRIDHYQGKETVQNLIVVRFANSLFEPLWNKDYIDHVEISVLEKVGAGRRAAFYDNAGALRDMVQNHLLQLLALTAMEEPKELRTELVRNEKAKVLNSLVPVNAKKIASQVVKGQYQGYRKEVGYNSNTETFVALKVFLDLPRWKGVPFYLRTGKHLSKKVTEITIHFKELPKCLFRNCASNVFVFRIQPDESVTLRINSKIPGLGVNLRQTGLEFGYRQAYKGEIPSAYERLLLDFIQGDQRLFIRSDEIEAAWKFIDKIRKHWQGLPLYIYKKGGNGPIAAEQFIQADGREWWTK